MFAALPRRAAQPEGPVVVLTEPGYGVDHDLRLVATRLLGDAYADACNVRVADAAESSPGATAKPAPMRAPCATARCWAWSSWRSGDRILIRAERIDPPDGDLPPHRLRAEAADANELPW